jgi:hypothetical protein
MSVSYQYSSIGEAMERSLPGAAATLDDYMMINDLYSVKKK